jgi:hypothetical protein
LIRVAGSLRFEAGAAPSRNGEGGLVRFVPSGGASGTFTTQIDQNGSFALGLPAGAYSLRPQVPNGWYVKSVSLADRDISDSPLEVGVKDLPAIVVTCSSAAGQLSGIARTADGVGDPNASVLLFPTDRDLWSGLGPLQRIRSSRVGRAGTYSISGIPSGDYYVAALDDARLENWPDSSFLESVSRSAVQVTIGANEKKTLELKEK